MTGAAVPDGADFVFMVEDALEKIIKLNIPVVHEKII